MQTVSGDGGDLGPVARESWGSDGASLSGDGSSKRAFDSPGGRWRQLFVSTLSTLTIDNHPSSIASNPSTVSVEGGLHFASLSQTIVP